MKGLNRWQTEGVTKTATPSLLILCAKGEG